MYRVLIAALGIVAIGATLATATSAGAGAESSGNQLAGTWIVTVNRPAPLPPLTSLQTYTDDGSMVESGNDTSARSPGYGSWERAQGRHYAATSVFFRFNPQTGAFIGSQRINRTIQLAEDGQSFTFVARVVVLDPNGNAITTFSVRSSGQRMEVERIPDQP